MFDVIIIGGGAAGAMAAVIAARNERKVAVFEKNEYIGRKLRITGKGRCNVTNNCGLQELLDNTPINSRFLYSAFSAFGTGDTVEFFENLGVPLKTERGNRVFPVSDNAEDIVNSLSKALHDNNVKIFNKKVDKITVQDGRCTGVWADGKHYSAESVLIATGGKSYPNTGSTGDGYKFAEKLGHTVTPLRPSLVPLVCNEKYCAALMGLSLKNVELRLYDGEKVIFGELGEMLFTHFGISGPLVLSASSHIREMAANRYKILIDLKPALDAKKLDIRIQRDFSENQNRDFANVARKLVPSALVPVIAELSSISGEQKVNSITKEQRLNLGKTLKNFPLTVKNFRSIEEAIITSGGISVKEINPKTMESKLIKGLYFAGEVIDVDAYTGGFNLQIAFSTAYVAGINM